MPATRVIRHLERTPPSSGFISPSAMAPGDAPRCRGCAKARDRSRAFVMLTDRDATVAAAGTDGAGR